MAPSMLGMFLNEISGISFIYSLEVGNLDLLQWLGKNTTYFLIGGEKLAFTMVESVKHHPKIKFNKYGGSFVMMIYRIKNGETRKPSYKKWCLDFL